MEEEKSSKILKYIIRLADPAHLGLASMAQFFNSNDEQEGAARLQASIFGTSFCMQICMSYFFLFREAGCFRGIFSHGTEE